MSEATDFAAEFAAVRDRYGRTLPDKIEAVAAALAEGDDVSRQRARELAHRLRGTAGSYGFPTVSEAAARIEDALLAGDLPGARRAAEEARRLALLGTAPTLPPPLTTRPRLLVIDADPLFLAQLSRALLAAPFEVSTANTPADALEVARAQRPDAALLAAAPAAEATAALIGALRALPGCIDLPVGVVAPDDGEAPRAAAAQAGASLFLSPPIDTAAVIEAGRLMLAPPARERSRVLIVDEDPDFRALAGHVLAQRGLHVEVAADASDLFDRLLDARPDLLLLDARLPGPRGDEICRMLRASPRWQDVPVLFVTAETSPESRIAAFRAGADDCLTRPVLAEELVARVEVRLERRRLLRERAGR